MQSNDKLTNTGGFCLARLRLAVLLLGFAGFYACADPIPSGCESGVCATDQTSCAEATRALAESVVGLWTGYIENFQAISSDDSIKISMSIDPGGTLSGQVVLGQQAPPAPASDPSIPWPASLQNITPTQAWTGSAGIPPSYIAGFAYTSQRIGWESRRLKFMIPKHEPWQPWCQLQQSFQVDANNFRCVPSADVLVKRIPGLIGPDGMEVIDPSGGPILDAAGNCQLATTPPTSFNCEKLILCDTVAGCACTGNSCNCGGRGVCECDAAGCKAGEQWMSVPIGYWFDIALLQGRGDGSINMSAGGTELYNIRLTQIRH
jgi:hypothetical protein